jgi:outer membrane protein OmpA-like peptidoglycan-associated protein
MHNPADWRNMLSSANAARLCVRVLAVIAVGGVVASCSSVGDTTRTVVRNLNPVNWFGDDDEDKQKKPPAVGKPSAAGKGFPKLGSVPGRPKRPSPEKQMKEIAEGLAADTANARYSDQQLRQSTAVFGGQTRPPGTIMASRQVSRSVTVRRKSSPTVARAVPATVTRPFAGTIAPPPALRAPAVRPPAVRPPAVRAPVVRAPLARSPAVRPPALIANQGIVSPPTVVRSPSVVRPRSPISSSAAVRPTTVSPAPPVARPAVRAPTVAPPLPVRVVQASERSLVTRPPVPTLRRIAARRQFATPVGSPNQAPKSPPVATPIGGTLGERTVALRPPNPARVNRSTSAYSAPVPQNAQSVAKSLQVGTIYFGDGSAQLSRQDRSILQAVSDVFQKMGGRVRVIGHSSMGARTFNSSRRETVNFKMSLKRANAVANELIRQGIPMENVEVIAEGDRSPVYAETSQTGAAHNRRTEIFIDYLERS